MNAAAIRRFVTSYAAILATGAAVVIALLWLGAWQRSQFESRQALDAAVTANSNLAVAYQENAMSALDDVAQTLRLIDNEYGIHGPASNAHGTQGPAFNDTSLGDLILNRVLIRQVSVLRADETSPFSAGEPGVAGQREELAFHRDRPGTEMHIGRPSRNPVTGQWRVPMSRRIDNPDGTFRGIALAMVDCDYFTRFYRETDLGANGIVVLFGSDGFSLARFDGGKNSYGDDMRVGTLWAMQGKSRSGSFESSGKHDGVRRLMSYRVLPRFGAIVQVGTAKNEALAQARGRERLYYLSAALATCFIVLATLGALRWMAGQRRYVESMAQAQALLRASDARTRAITDNMAGGVITSDIDGTILSANTSACRMYGYRPAELIGQHMSRLVHESEYAHLAATFEQLRGRDGDFKEEGREFLSIRRDGTSFEVEVLISGLVLDGVRTYVGIVHDITERKRMEQALRASEARFRATFDQALVGIVHSDLTGRFIRANQMFYDMLGYSQHELSSRTFADISLPEERAASTARLHQLLANPDLASARHVAKRYVRKDGSILWAVVSISMILRSDGSPDHFLSMIQDITELKRAERMKDEFVSTVSHELRTPLTSISGSLGLMLGGIAGELPAPARELVGIASRNCERLIRLVNDILDTAKLESGKMDFELHVAKVAPLIEHAIECNVGFAQEHGVQLTCIAPDEAIRASVDADRFNQAVTNLLSNAVKFSPPGGIVEVTLTRRASNARIEVRDQGPGIPAEFRGRIFQRFAQADSSDAKERGGTGLGLSITKAIVERMDGTIGFESTAGEGTTFYFELPLAAAPARVARPTTAEA